MSSEKHPQIWWGMVKFSQIIPHFGTRGSCLYEGVPQQHPGNQLAPLGNVTPGCLSGYADAFEEKLRLIWVVLMLL